MAIETERKFLVESPPTDALLGVGIALRQGYLARDGAVEVRIRITDDAAVLTVKAGKGLQRSEVEVAVSLVDAEDLWPHTEGRRIEKVRHRLSVGEHIAEVDRYGGGLEGLLTVEVEFSSPEAAAAFLPPPWFGRELTGEDRWSNAALAEHGRPD